MVRFSFLNCIKIHKTFERALGKSYQRITNMLPKTIWILLKMTPHLYSNACFPVSLSQSTPLSLGEKNSLSAVRSIWNWSSFSSIVQRSTVTKVRKTELSRNLPLAVIRFFKTTVKLSENVYSSKVFPKRRKLLCLNYLLFLATRSLIG